MNFNASNSGTVTVQGEWHGPQYHFSMGFPGLGLIGSGMIEYDFWTKEEADKFLKTLPKEYLRAIILSQ